MIDLRAHRKWIGILAAALLIGVANGPLLGFAIDKAELSRASRLQQKEKALGDLRQLKDDIAAAASMKDQIDAADAKKSLAPVDRLRVARVLENRAAEAHLSKLSYSFSPEEKVAFDTVGAGKQDFAKSKWTLSADAPSDTDVYAFLDALTRTLPGRVTLSNLLLERMDGKDAISEANLRFSATGEWLSNGASALPAAAELAP